MKYVYKKIDARQFSKHGIDLVVYGQHIPEANVVQVSCTEGHFQEFYDKVSTYTYYIESGAGIFYLNGEELRVGATDIVAIPANTRIHYFGTMEMVLTVAPAFNPENEVHVRFVEASENPFSKGNL